ncbi:MAG: hypothetical protein OEY01_07080 [Desulfobulbaceae bacterium]|nr:hypothetical protein [Desulfobulbaceae bacterium]HIJ78819.1 hypothetical protein [Deltaproteobacteria bacterium]
MLILEIVSFIATIILGVLWIKFPNYNWEPWIVLCGAVTLAADLIRRVTNERHSKASSVIIPPQNARTLSQEAKWLKSNIHEAKLSESLPRALQFSKSIDNKKLERWIRLELYGYNKDGGMTDNDFVPEYRAVTGRWVDQFNQMLDITHYSGDISIVNEYRFRYGVAKLEDLASRHDMQNIADEHFINLLREHMGVEVIRFCFSPVEIRGVLDTIRNKLAEMVLDCLSSEKASL